MRVTKRSERERERGREGAKHTDSEKHKNARTTAIGAYRDRWANEQSGERRPLDPGRRKGARRD